MFLLIIQPAADLEMCFFFFVLFVYAIGQNLP